MTRKDEFLRAVQLQPFGRTGDLPLTFGLAMNLAEQNIPTDLALGAREFVARISGTPSPKDASMRVKKISN